MSTFDPLNRLSTKQPGTLALQTMTYDLAGRLLNINTPTDPDDPTSGDYGYDYDSAGRLIEQSMPDARLSLTNWTTTATGRSLFIQMDIMHLIFTMS